MTYRIATAPKTSIKNCIMADNLTYSDIISAKLRHPSPSSVPMPSIMREVSEPEPYIGLPTQKEPGLESVSPEDLIPNPKTLVAVLKGAPLVLGAVKSKVSELSMLNEAGKKLFGKEASGYLPYGAGTAKSKPLHKFIKEDVLDTFNDEPYNLFPDMDGSVSLSQLPRDELSRRLKEHLRDDKSFNYLLGIQGLAHGVDTQTGQALHLNNVGELLGKKTFVGAHTDTPTHSLYRLSDSSKSVDELVDNIVKLYPRSGATPFNAMKSPSAVSDYEKESFEKMISGAQKRAEDFAASGQNDKAAYEMDNVNRLRSILEKKLRGT